MNPAAILSLITTIYEQLVDAQEALALANARIKELEGEKS